MATKKCKHYGIVITWTADDREFARCCGDCGQRLSMGPSNDEPAEVQEEIEAAAIASPDSHYMQAFSAHDAGWMSYETDADPPVMAGIGWRAGWLAHAITTHDDQQSAITASLAEGSAQLERIAESPEYGERITEQTRHDIAASVVRHAEIEPQPARTADVLTEMVGQLADAIAAAPFVPARKGLTAVAAMSTSGPVTFHLGDASWHDGPGWYYTISGCPEEVSCGAFADRAIAEAHASSLGFEVTPAAIAATSDTASSDSAAVAIYVAMDRDPVDALDMIAKCKDVRALELLLEMLRTPCARSDRGLNATFVEPVRRRIAKLAPADPQPPVSWPPHTGCDPAQVDERFDDGGES